MYDQIAANKRRTVVLIASFVVVVVATGVAVNLLLGGGPIGILLAIVVSGALAFGSYWKSDAVTLAVSRARPADPTEYRRLYNLVEGLCIGSGLPMPKLYVIDDPAPNAFATGRDPKHAAVAVTTGLLTLMNRVELEGVLAHELSHIRNYDILVSTLAVTMVGAVALVSDTIIRLMWWNGGRVSRGDDRDDSTNPLALLGFVFLLLAPLLARLMHFAISRNRETLADVSAVQITRYPPGLISALEKLRADSTVTHSASRATVRAEQGRLSRFNRLFDTHPPLDERIALLREL
jgi:heat shock protein HtpX